MSDSSNSEPPSERRSNPSDQRVLAGQTVLITRPAEQADSLRQLLEKLGAKTVVHPVIRIGPPQDQTAVDEAIKRIGDFDRIVFVSANGVRFFLERIVELTGSTELLRGHRMAAIGAATSEHLAALGGFQVDIVPPRSDSQALGQLLAKNGVGQKLLVVRADRGSQELANALREVGIEFEELVAYRNFDVEVADPEVTRQLQSGCIDWVTVTSSAIARSTVRLFGDDLCNSRLVSISPTTSATLRESGFPPAAEAKDYNMAGIVNAIRESVD